MNVGAQDSCLYSAGNKTKDPRTTIDDNALVLGKPQSRSSLNIFPLCGDRGCASIRPYGFELSWQVQGAIWDQKQPYPIEHRFPSLIPARDKVERKEIEELQKQQLLGFTTRELAQLGCLYVGDHAATCETDITHFDVESSTPMGRGYISSTADAC